MKKSFFISVLLCVCTLSWGKVELPRFFSSHMVLQQNEPITIFGKAQVGEAITVTFNNSSLEAVGDASGFWSVTFSPMKAGGPFTMEIKGVNTITLSDVYLGEVWFCSGQSNMGWKLEDALNGEQELANANYPEIKLFTVPRYMSSTLETDVKKGAWETCTPENAKGFSAVAYFFGRYLYEQYKVPIGLINSSWGGTNIEAWMSSELLAQHPESQKIISGIKGKDMIEAVNQYKLDHKNYSVLLDEKDLGSQQHWELETTTYKSWKTFNLPTLWKNTKLEQTHGVVWVTKTITLSKEEAQENLSLSIGRVDDEDVTYFNGIEIGASQKKDLDRVYAVPKELLREGSNRITIRTKNLLDLGGFRGSKSDLFLQTKTRTIPLDGKWQYKEGTPKVQEPPVRVHPRYFPTTLYNSMVHPFFKYKVKGVIWYQGESNTKNPDEYAQFFPEMINLWRTNWGKELPFLYVQVANYANQDNREAPLRNAQAAALKLDKTAMVVTLDIGEDANVHPRNKQEVGKRLGMAARNLAYGETEIAKSGPTPVNVEFQKKSVLIAFNQDLKIKASTSGVNGFMLSCDNKKFYPAQVTSVDSKTLKLVADKVKAPKYIKYLWADAPGEVMIYNLQDLPAPPFKFSKDDTNN